MTVMQGAGCVCALMDGLKKWQNGEIREESEEGTALKLMLRLPYSGNVQCWENGDCLLDRFRERTAGLEMDKDVSWMDETMDGTMDGWMDGCVPEAAWLQKHSASGWRYISLLRYINTLIVWDTVWSCASLPTSSVKPWHFVPPLSNTHWPFVQQPLDFD